MLIPQRLKANEWIFFIALILNKKKEERAHADIFHQVYYNALSFMLILKRNPE